MMRHAPSRFAILAVLLGASALASCRDRTPDLPVADEGRRFVEAYTAEWLDLYSKATEADWQANVRIEEGDTTLAAASAAAQAELAAFEGSTYNIAVIRELLRRRSELDTLTAMQLDKLLYKAGKNPQSVPDLVARRIRLQADLTSELFGFDFRVDGRSVSANEIDRRLREETDLDARLATWEASKAVGVVLKEGLAELRDARNETVQALGYDDYFAYEVSEYGMTTDEMVDLAHQSIAGCCSLRDRRRVNVGEDWHRGLGEGD